MREELRERGLRISSPTDSDPHHSDWRVATTRLIIFKQFYSICVMPVFRLHFNSKREAVCGVHNGKIIVFFLIFLFFKTGLYIFFSYPTICPLAATL